MDIVTDATPADNKPDGLRQKYCVYKAKDNTPVEDCFVLRPEKDPAARIALEAYAKATENKVLAEDILAAIGDSGRVVILPCKTGDTVYRISWRLNGRHEIEERVFSLMYFDPAKCGKDYFLTREEAEKALEAMKDE